MKKTLTKSLALLLAVLMLMTAMPMGVFATGDEQVDTSNCRHLGTMQYKEAKQKDKDNHGENEHYECSVCHGWFEIAANGQADPNKPIKDEDKYIHNFDSWPVPDKLDELDEELQASILEHRASEATCQNKAKYYKKCTVPGCEVYSKTETFDTGKTAEHTWGAEYAPDGADCTKAGFTINKKCTVCGEIEKVRDVPKQDAHDTIDKPKEDSTCTEEGHESGVYCTNCVKYLTGGEVIAMKSHNVQVITKGYAATCTEPGMTDFIGCRTCHTKDVPATVIPAINHVGGLIWVDEKVGTCEEDGYKKHARICKFCDKVFDPANEPTSAVVIKATGHNTEIVEERAATTSSKGWIRHYKCTNKNSDGTPCGQLFLREKGPDGVELGTPENPVLRKATEAEVMIPVKPHEHKLYKDTNLSKDKTCLVDGRLVMRCDQCGEIITDEVLKATGHNWKWVDAQASTCTKEGTRYEECTVCGERRGELVTSAKAEHTWKLTTPADCTKGGKATYTCEVCGATKQEDVAKQSSHTDADDNGVCDICSTKFCSCLCHNKTWYGKIIYFFVQVWWQFLSIRPTCECGKVHYVKPASTDIPSVT